MLLCASGLRPPSSVGEEPLLRLVADAGCQGILLGEGCTLPAAAPLVTRALRAGLAVGALAAPLGDGAIGVRKRLPCLAARERDEREAAIELVARVMALAGSVGASLVSLHMGWLPLAARPAELSRFFRRREVGEGDEGEACLADALEERRATVDRALDACRWSLDALAREGERRHVRIAVELAATPWGVPSPREGLDLMPGYDGTQIGVVLDPARLTLMGRLGLSISRERLASLRAATLLVAANEAVGLDAGYLPGLGERDPVLAARDGVPADTLVALIGGPDSTDAEVSAAVAMLRAEAKG